MSQDLLNPENSHEGKKLGHFRKRSATNAENIKMKINVESSNFSSFDSQKEPFIVEPKSSDFIETVRINKIRKFKTIALVIRCLISLMPRSYFVSQAIYEEEDGVKLLKAGTVETIIDSIAPKESADATHIRHFIITYRFFMTTTDLINRLSDKYKNAVNNPTEENKVIPLRIVNFFRIWIKEFSYDFHKELDEVNLVKTFMESEVKKSHDISLSKWAETLIAFLNEEHERWDTGIKRSTSFPIQNTTPSVFQFESSSEFSQMNPVEIFRQLTLIEVDLFKKITAKDLYYKIVKKQFDKCPNLISLINHFNKVSFWVASEICSVNDLKQRSVVLKRFIHIAYICFEFKNFNTCLEIVGGLSMTCVQRLRKTWKNLSNKYLTMWAEIDSVMSPRQNYLFYRNYLKTVTGSVFPYFGLFLSDVTLVQEKFATKLTGKLINFHKMRMLSQVVTDMKRYQSQVSFPFGDNHDVRKFLETGMICYDEDKLYSISKQLEESSSDHSHRFISGTLSPRRLSDAEDYLKDKN